MGLGHDRTGTQWDDNMTGLGHNEIRTRRDWDIVGQEYDRIGTQWDQNTTILCQMGLYTTSL